MLHAGMFSVSLCVLRVGIVRNNNGHKGVRCEQGIKPFLLPPGGGANTASLVEICDYDF